MSIPTTVMGHGSDRLLSGAGLGSLPRVNLLPPELAQARRLRQVQFGMGAAVLAAVVVVGLLYVGAQSSVTSAEEQLATSSATSSQLTAETAKFRDVTAVYQQAANAQALLTEAMGQEVRWSQLLSDLSLSVPEKVWVTNLSFAQETVEPAVGATEPGIGSLTVQGVGYSHDDVAVWLESLASSGTTYANPYFSNSTETLIGSRTVVNFDSTATVKPDALSGRYTTPAGG